MIEFVVNEIRRGTIASRKFLIWLLDDGYCYQDEPDKQIRHREQLDINRARIIGELTILSETADKANREVAQRLIRKMLAGRSGQPNTGLSSLLH